MSLRSRSSKCLGAFIIATGLVTFTPTRALAQNKPGTFDITPFLGINFGGDLDGASPGIGVAGGYNWSPNLSFEGEFSVLPDVVGGDSNIDQRVVTLSGNGVYHFNTGTNITPYATLGIGIGHTSLTIKTPPETETSDTGFQVNLGGGVKADLSERFGVRGDLRYFHTNDQASFVRLYGGVVFKFPR
jgi:opacity protein-like surface antigen